MSIQNGVTIVGGNEQGNRMDQLNGITDVIIDKKNDSILIYDNRNLDEWCDGLVEMKQLDRQSSLTLTAPA